MLETANTDLFTELGTFGIFEIFNIKKIFFAFFIRLITYFCTSPI